MWGLAADSGAPSEALGLAIWTFWGVVVTTVGLIVQQYMKSRGDRTSSAPPPPSSVDGSMVMELAKDVGQLDQRASDSDERDDMQDRALGNHGERLDRIEWFLDMHHRDWPGDR